MSPVTRTTAFGRPIVFADTETTGLDTLTALPWEVFMSKTVKGVRETLHIMVDLFGSASFDPDDETGVISEGMNASLEFGGYWQRHPLSPQYDGSSDDAEVLSKEDAASRIVEFTEGCAIAGMNVKFDVHVMQGLLGVAGLTPKWDYHSIDVENFMIPHLARQGCLPSEWRSSDLSRALGVDRGRFEAHTAEGDVLWCEAIWGVITSEFRGCSGYSSEAEDLRAANAILRAELEIMSGEDFALPIPGDTVISISEEAIDRAVSDMVEQMSESADWKQASKEHQIIALESISTTARSVIEIATPFILSNEHMRLASDSAFSANRDKHIELAKRLSNGLSINEVLRSTRLFEGYSLAQIASIIEVEEDRLIEFEFGRLNPETFEFHDIAEKYMRVFEDETE